MNSFIFTAAGFAIALFSILFTIFYIIYTKNKKKKIKKAIWYSLFGTIFGIIVVCLLTFFSGLNRNINKSSNFEKDATPSFQVQSKIYPYLTEEQNRREISEFLKIGDTEKAIELLRYLRSDKAKDEECERIFEYCLKNGKLDAAKKVIMYFRRSSKRDDAERQLALEMLKKK